MATFTVNRFFFAALLLIAVVPFSSAWKYKDICFSKYQMLLQVRRLWIHYQGVQDIWLLVQEVQNGLQTAMLLQVREGAAEELQDRLEEDQDLQGPQVLPPRQAIISY